MNDLLEQSVGYFLLEYDIPEYHLFAEDRVHFDGNPDSNAPLVVALWNGKAHLCQNVGYGMLRDCYTGAEVPTDAEVLGRALGYSRTKFE